MLTEREAADRCAGLIEQIKRDQAVLDGPACYCPEREFYEERIQKCRLTIIGLRETMGIVEG